MVKFKHEINVSGRTRKDALKAIRKFAKGLGMVAEKISMKQRGAMRVGGKKVFKASLTLRTKKKRKR